ncbi:hypothetical protein GA707_10355 [Nostocoides sp. F2B08]|uniref:hypothetical protein n=1 Tax=Nostocoides sp. F2B08 TaxID=2653936 RepID=UPI001262D039|nr:hypothetical protein [Tetrasphaera sp. F2B08]KAB7743881.1 hypothetical protein GA707_10355 [Tetrasphaera sp. F2B08]
MRKRIPLSQREDYDVLAEFEGNDDPTDDTDFFADRGRMARSAGATLALMLLAAVAFAGGVAWGATREVSVAPGNAVWDIVIHIGFAVACGLLAGAAVVAVGMLVIGIPYARGKMAETRARNARRGS